MHLHQPAGIFAAAGKGDFELAAEILAVRMPQQKPIKRASVRRDIETFPGADSCQRTCRHIPHAIAAGLTGRDTD